MKTTKISEAVVRRLPIYLRYLTHLHHMNVKTVSSQKLGDILDINPAQIRKDLAHFGEFGRKGIGYEVDYLIEKIKQILKLDQEIHVALIGVGHLGHAILNYNAYLKENMKIVAAFDVDPQKTGEVVAGTTVYHLDQLGDIIEEKAIRMAIITVPAEAAQEVADRLMQTRIKAILNFAPVNIKARDDVRVHHTDVTTELQSLSYYL